MTNTAEPMQPDSQPYRPSQQEQQHGNQPERQEQRHPQGGTARTPMTDMQADESSNAAPLVPAAAGLDAESSPSR